MEQQAEHAVMEQQAEYGYKTNHYIYFQAIIVVWFLCTLWRLYTELLVRYNPRPSNRSPEILKIYSCVLSIFFLSHMLFLSHPRSDYMQPPPAKDSRSVMLPTRHLHLATCASRRTQPRRTLNYFNLLSSTNLQDSPSNADSELSCIVVAPDSRSRVGSGIPC